MRERVARRQREVQGKLKLVNRGELKGRFSTTLFDPANNPFCEYTGTIDGIRLVPMPF